MSITVPVIWLISVRIVVCVSFVKYSIALSTETLGENEMREAYLQTYGLKTGRGGLGLWTQTRSLDSIEMLCGNREENIGNGGRKYNRRR